VDTPEAGDERADTAESDREADLGDRAIGVAQQCGRTFEPSGQQILVWRLAERAPELPAEVSE
jgi:hypothetical protein